MSAFHYGSFLLGAWVVCVFIPFFNNDAIRAEPFWFKALLGALMPTLPLVAGVAALWQSIKRAEV